MYALQIGTSFCYESGQLVLIQIRASVVTNWGSFIITNWGKCCYKLAQTLLFFFIIQQILQVLTKDRKNKIKTH